MRLFKMLAVVLAVAVATPASAAIHKCIDKDGKASWTDKPCTVYPTASAPAQPEATAEPEPVPAPEAAAPSQPEAQPAAPEASTSNSYSAPAEPSQEEQAQLEQEQADAIQAEFAERVKHKMGLIGLASILMLVGWIMHIVAAAKLDKVVWAICLFLFSPLSNLLFTILNWQAAKKGFFVYLAGTVLMIGTMISLFAGLAPH